MESLTSHHHHLLSAIGLLTTLVLLARLLRFLSPYLLLPRLRPGRGLRRYLHRSADGRPAWALVTGASDGIGRQLARELAAAGFCVVLHGRNRPKLDAARDELAALFPGRGFRVLVADASAIPCASCASSSPNHPSDHATTTTTHVDFDAIAASLADLHLTVLVNNAGGNPYPPVYAPLADQDPARLAALLNLNALFPLALQARLLPQLRGHGGPALVLGIGSLSDVGLPLLAAYSPAKAHLVAVAHALARELAMEKKRHVARARARAQRGEVGEVGEAGSGGEVEVLVVRVGEVCGTAYNKTAPSLWQPDARTMARAVLARVGCGRVVVVGYFWHALQAAALSWLPGWMRDRAISDVIEERWELDQKMIKEA